MRGRRQRSGYVLLLTLLLVSIAATAMTVVGRRSLAAGLRARESHEALQRRWAVTSCQRTFLPQAEAILDRAGQQSAQPVSTVRFELELSGLNRERDLRHGEPP